jgi:hypothetical protein
MFSLLSSDTILFRDISAWDDFVRRAGHRDPEVLERQVAEGSAIAIASGSRVRLDADLATLAQVTVLDGPGKGLSGLVTWLSLEPRRTAA